MKAIASLYDRQGRRKFLTTSERDAFLEAAHDAPAERRTLFWILAHTGCQIHEALELTCSDIDLSGHAVLLGAGKKRRSVPLPPDVMSALDAIHGIRRAGEKGEQAMQKRLWPVDRSTTSRWLNRLMTQAGIAGPQASFRGLRHAFALEALKSGVDIKMLATWMGYEDHESLSVYVAHLRTNPSEN